MVSSLPSGELSWTEQKPLDCEPVRIYQFLDTGWDNFKSCSNQGLLTFTLRREFSGNICLLPTANLNACLLAYAVSACNAAMGFYILQYCPTYTKTRLLIIIISEKQWKINRSQVFVCLIRFLFIHCGLLILSNTTLRWHEAQLHVTEIMDGGKNEILHVPKPFRNSFGEGQGLVTMICVQTNKHVPGDRGILRKELYFVDLGGTGSYSWVSLEHWNPCRLLNIFE